MPSNPTAQSSLSIAAMEPLEYAVPNLHGPTHLHPQITVAYIKSWERKLMLWRELLLGFQRSLSCRWSYWHPWSLSESIAFDIFRNLKTLAVISKAKGTNVYSWEDRRGFLCFARQKRGFLGICIKMKLAFELCLVPCITAHFSYMSGSTASTVSNYVWNQTNK